MVVCSGPTSFGIYVYGTKHRSSGLGKGSCALDPSQVTLLLTVPGCLSDSYSFCVTDSKYNITTRFWSRSLKILMAPYNLTIPTTKIEIYHQISLLRGWKFSPDVLPDNRLSVFFFPKKLTQHSAIYHTYCIHYWYMSVQIRQQILLESVTEV